MKAGSSKTGILLAAYGTASRKGDAALALFAEKTRQSFPGIPVRWAYTSHRMRSRLAAAGKKTDSVKKALCRMGFERYTHVAVQSLHLIPGVEYEALAEESQSACHEGGPARISVGLPLLYDEQDLALAAEALLAHLPAQRSPDEAVVCMGHGTWHGSGARYAALAERVNARDPHIFIGTMDGARSIDGILESLAVTDVRKVWLLPLLSIIGKHAEEDMAGPRGASWRGRIAAAGYRCLPVLTGTVEYDGFARIWLAHLEKALTDLGV